MSLMRLLTAGSSLMGIKDRPGAYKMTQQNLLPKFGTEKYADRKTAAIEAAPQGAPVLRQEHAPKVQGLKPHYTPPVRGDLNEETVTGSENILPQRAQMIAAELDRKNDPADERETQPPVRDELIAPASQVMAERKPRPALGIFRRWAEKRNPFRGKRPERRAVAPVQGELRLESIQVVRNDLRESDLEIVPAAKPLEADAAPAASGPGSAETRVVWQRVAARLFGAGRS